MNLQFPDTRPLGDGTILKVEFDQYLETQSLAMLLISVESGEYWSTATTNLITRGDIPPGCVAIKDYTENEGMVDLLIQNGYIEPEPIWHVASGYVQIPVHWLTQEALDLAELHLNDAHMQAVHIGEEC